LGSARRRSTGKRLRAITPHNALLETLVALRTCLGTRVIATWMGLPHGTTGRVFVSWYGFMRQFFMSESPVPPVEGMQGPKMEEWRAAYGSSRIGLNYVGNSHAA